MHITCQGIGQHKDRGRRSEVRDRRTDDRRQKTRDRRQKKEEDGDSTVGAAFSRDRINFYDFNDLNGFNDFYGFYDLPFTVYHSRLDESTTGYYILWLRSSHHFRRKIFIIRPKNAVNITKAAMSPIGTATKTLSFKTNMSRGTKTNRISPITISARHPVRKSLLNSCSTGFSSISFIVPYP